MAIEYTLYFDSDRSALELHQVIDGSLSIAPSTVHCFAKLGLQGAAWAPDDLTRKFVYENCLVDARVQVHFQLDKFNLDRAQDSLVRCISALAAADAGDMLLLFNGELTVLLRQGLDLILQENFTVWTPERVSLFTSPPRLGSINQV